MNILILWTRMSAYMEAQFHCLIENGFDVRIVCVSSSSVAPFFSDDSGYTLKLNSLNSLKNHKSLSSVYSFLNGWTPDLILTASWAWPLYREIVIGYKKHFSSIKAACCFDNQLIYSPKQFVGRFFSKTYLHSLYDFAFVPGPPQHRLASWLGFKPSSIFYGLYCSSIPRLLSPRVCKRFVYLGRLVPQKGIANLLDAYSLYCDNSDGPAWPLSMIGSGELASLVASYPSVDHIPYLQGDQFVNEISKGGVLIAPSFVENWGVNIHDAVRVSMPLIVPFSSGASQVFATPFANAVFIDPANVNSILYAMKYYSSISDISLSAHALHSLNSSDLVSASSFLDSVRLMCN